jgi:hypothetical protein
VAAVVREEEDELEKALALSRQLEEERKEEIKREENEAKER